MLCRINSLLRLLLDAWWRSRDPLLLQALLAALELRALLADLESHIRDVPPINLEADADRFPPSELIRVERLLDAYRLDALPGIFDVLLQQDFRAEKSTGVPAGAVIFAEFRRVLAAKEQSQHEEVLKVKSSRSEVVESKLFDTVEIDDRILKIVRWSDHPTIDYPKFGTSIRDKYNEKMIEDFREFLESAGNFESVTDVPQTAAVVAAPKHLVAMQRIVSTDLTPFTKRSRSLLLELSRTPVGVLRQVSESIFSKLEALYSVIVEAAIRLVGIEKSKSKGRNGKIDGGDTDRVVLLVESGEIIVPTYCLQDFVSSHHPAIVDLCGSSDRSPCSHEQQLTQSLVEKILNGSQCAVDTRVVVQSLWKFNPAFDRPFFNHLTAAYIGIGRRTPQRLLSALCEALQLRIRRVLQNEDARLTISTSAVFRLFKLENRRWELSHGGGIPPSIRLDYEVEDNDRDTMMLEIPWLNNFATDGALSEISSGPFGWVKFPHRSTQIDRIPTVAAAVASLSLAVFAFQNFDWHAAA